MGIYMMKLLVVVGLIAAAAAIQDSYLDVESFKGFQVFRVSPSNEDDRNYIKVLGNRPYYDFWSEVRKDHTVDIMAPPEYVHQLEKDLEVRGISYEVMIPDVDAVIQLEKITAKTREVPSSDHPMTWDKYHPLEDMYAFLDYLENTYDFVTTSVIGSSGEGTPMRVVKVCEGGCGNKKAVWIDGGIHAREWISPAAVSWMLRELVENDASHPDLTSVLDWHFLVSHNPDGYEYSRTSNRMWRKTRSYTGHWSCRGVDGNRNYGFQWNQGGSSNNHCSDVYHGTNPWSEVETASVRDYILQRRGEWIFYDSIHAYGNMIL